MNYIKHFNLFGNDVMQLPCIKSATPPTENTVGGGRFSFNGNKWYQ